MYNIPTYERIILRHLFKNKDAVDIYFFHAQYKLSHIQIYSVIDKYPLYIECQKIENSLTIKLTSLGRQYLYHNRIKLLKSDKSFLNKKNVYIFKKKKDLQLSDKSLKHIINRDKKHEEGSINN